MNSTVKLSKCRQIKKKNIGKYIKLMIVILSLVHLMLFINIIIILFFGGEAFLFLLCYISTYYVLISNSEMHMESYTRLFYSEWNVTSLSYPGSPADFQNCHVRLLKLFTAQWYVAEEVRRGYNRAWALLDKP